MKILYSNGKGPLKKLSEHYFIVSKRILLELVVSISTF